MRPLLVSQNRLGGAVTYFGKQIKDLSEIMSVHADISSALVTEEDTLLEDEHEHRKNLIKPLTPISPLVEQGRKNDEERKTKDEERKRDIREVRIMDITNVDQIPPRYVLDGRS